MNTQQVLMPGGTHFAYFMSRSLVNEAWGGTSLTNKRPLAFTITLGVAAAALAASAVIAPGSAFLSAPSAFFWVALAALVAVVPVRQLIGTQNLNLAPLVVFTALLLYGTAAAVVSAWVVAFTSVLSTRSGHLRADFERGLLHTGKYTLGTWVAGLVLLGTTTGGQTLDSELGMGIIPTLLLAYGSYLGVKWTIESLAVVLRDDGVFRDLRLPRIDWSGISVWVVPPAAYLLASAYLSSGVLTITMLISLLVVQGLTVGEDRRSRSSWVRLTDGLRQACDGHIMRHGGETQAVVEIATAVGRKLKLPPGNLRLLGHAATLHNVGYIALDSRIVLRPGELSPEEIAAVKQHPDSGRRILNEVDGMADVAEIVGCHHESPDGKGYPRRLSGNAIPIEAAIVKTVEAFVAMTSPRVYRGKALSRDQALEEIAASAGQAFDPIAAYYLFDAMGRTDLASRLSKQFGPPDRSSIKSRLSRPKPRRECGRIGPSAKSILSGVALISAALGIAVSFDRLGLSTPLQAPPTWFTLDVPGAAFLISLFALAVLRPGRLAWGAYCSWVSAPVLAMVLAGGPIYIPISGMAFIGWAFVLRPASRRSLQHNGKDSEGRSGVGQTQSGDCGFAPGTDAGNIPAAAHRLHASKVHSRVIARIDRANRVDTELDARTYGLVLMVAGAFSWAACLLGHQIWKASIIGLVLSPLLVGILSVGTFYAVETLLQAALLSRGSLSPARVWYRNFASAFPEPLTYAMMGFGIYIVSSLLGLWAAMLVFTLPILWRHGVLAGRMRILETTNDLVRSIAKAVDLKNARGRSHAQSVAIAAAAIARQMGKPEAFIEQLEDAALLHDIGKASWPNKALTQQTPWDSREERYRYIHPDMSAEIGTLAGYPEATTSMIRSHHEHFDGSGYMRGLKEEKIPPGARILCAADSFANMIQGGDPRFSRTLAETVREIRFGSGKQFDPEVVRALLQVLEWAVFGDAAESEEAPPGNLPEEVAVGT
jgi:putative nucleotidyltransferase with HDIG domain